MRFIFALLLLVFTIGNVAAQETQALTITTYEVETQFDVLEIPQLVVEGILTNTSRETYANIEIIVDVLNDNNEVVGEGYGYVTDACGTALLDFVLFPGQSTLFSATLELFVPGSDIDQLQFLAEGLLSDVRPDKSVIAYAGVTNITIGEEVVAVEWIDNDNLRFGTGCESDLFTDWEWSQYSLSTDVRQIIEHPSRALVTEVMLQQAGLRTLSQGGDENAFIADTSRLTFSPNSNRVIYQNDLQTLFTAQQDGSFRRIVQDKLHQFSLQGFALSPDGNNFLAYYYGAYGDPVRYVVGSMEGKLLSTTINTVVPSITLPGLTPDASGVIIGATFDDVTGYYIQSPVFVSNELLFEAVLPGNNYPAPVYVAKGAGKNYVYVIRPIAGQATIQCFHREENVLHTLTAVPLDVRPHERAWSAISPDQTKLAFYANGQNGGLWVVDLTQAGVCL